MKKHENEKCSSEIIWTHCVTSKMWHLTNEGKLTLGTYIMAVRKKYRFKILKEIKFKFFKISYQNVSKIIDCYGLKI